MDTLIPYISYKIFINMYTREQDTTYFEISEVTISVSLLIGKFAAV